MKVAIKLPVLDNDSFVDENGVVVSETAVNAQKATTYTRKSIYEKEHGTTSTPNTTPGGNTPNNNAPNNNTPGNSANNGQHPSVQEPQTKLLPQTIKYKKPKTYKAKNLKKKAASFYLKASSTSNSDIVYKVTKGNKKYVSVKANGKVTLKKGCKKGTYKIKITALQTKRFASASKTVTIKVK